MLTLDQIRREFRIEFGSSDKISQFGGLQSFISFLERMSLKERLEMQFGELKSRSVLQLMLGIVSGAADMEEVARVGADPVVKKYLGRAVSETKIARDLRSFDRGQIEALHELVLSAGTAELLSHIPRDGIVEMDVDATSIEKFGEQEGVEYGYIEKDKIKPCYQYLFFRSSQLNSFLYGTIRGGAAHSQNDFVSYLRRLLPAKQERMGILRGDSGYFNEEAFDVCAEHNTFFFIRAPMMDVRKSQAESGHLQWEVDPDDGYEYASYVTRTAAGTEWREVFRRKRLADDAGSLFGSFRFDCIATNDMNRRASDVFLQYNKRSNIENNIKEMKYDYKLGAIVTKWFDCNDVITQGTILAYVLMQHFKRTFLDDSMHKMQLSSLRWRLFNIPGFMLRGARRKWCRISNAFMSIEAYQRIFTRLAEKMSVFFKPPAIAW